MALRILFGVCFLLTLALLSNGADMVAKVSCNEPAACASQKANCKKDTVNKLCPKTCKTCDIPLTCYDKIDAATCFSYFQSGMCHLQPRLMAASCQKTCRFCDAAKSCPPYWVLIDNICYKFVKTPKSWAEAQVDCQQSIIGANLVKIESNNENIFVRELSKNAQLKEPWIGVTAMDFGLMFSDQSQVYPGQLDHFFKKGTQFKAGTSAVLNLNSMKWEMVDSNSKHGYVCARLASGFCESKCGENAFCTFSRGTSGKMSYRCLCKPGYFGDPRKSCQKPCECSGRGDPHYETYDGQMIHFMGNCTYVLTRLISNLAYKKECKFEVRVRNEDRRPDPIAAASSVQLSWTKNVVILINGHEIELLKNKVVKIDGQQVKGSTKHDISFTDNGVTYRGPAKCGFFEVSFMDDLDVSVRLDRTLYKKKLEGLCGNCNGRVEDDYLTPNGKNVRNHINADAILGHSWRVKNAEDGEDEKRCKVEKKTFPSCKDDVAKRAKKICGRILDVKDAVFGPCAKKIGDRLSAVATDCYWDACGDEKDNDKNQCAHYAYVARQCRKHGVLIPKWREMLKCPMKCPPNSIYIYIMPPSVKSCVVNTDMAKAMLIKTTPAEGCMCKKGFMKYGDACIAHCGCEDKATGNLHMVGESWVSKDCTIKYHCDSPGKISKKTHKCGKNTKCTARGGHHGCFCKLGFAGNPLKECKNINECANNLVRSLHDENSKCVDTEGSFKFVCLPGFRRVEKPGVKIFTCENIDECEKNPCPANGVCYDTPGSYECQCKSGFRMTKDKKKCVDINECHPKNPCSGVKFATCKNLNGSYSCVCVPGTRDKNGGKDKKKPVCEDINECTEQKGICKQPNTACRNTPTSYLCPCKTGFKMVNGKCIDDNECLKRPCKNSICSNSIGSYTCICRRGFARVNRHEKDPSRFLCRDINECLTKRKLCVDHAICVNTPGTYSCQCMAGYFGDGRRKCEAINPCKENPRICGDNARCKFKGAPNSHSCICNAGYEIRDGRCKNIDECKAEKDNCDHKMSKCVDTSPGYLCNCRSGTIKNEKTDKCDDINECTNKNFKDVCGKNEICVNDVPGYHCNCKPGYRKVKGQCIDVDECKSNVCGVEYNCINTPGSYKCECKPGYIKSKKGKCIDFNECDVTTKNKCSNNGFCSNLPGDYNCECKEGFFGNGFHCSDNNVNCSVNAKTKKKECDCASGYRRVGNECIDIDECTDKKSPHKCHTNATCFNTAGAYTCKCQSGFCGSGYDCHDENECTNNMHNCHKHATCFNKVGTFSCKCDSGYEGDGLECKDIDECALKKDKCVNAVCVNNDGDYDCECLPGFKKSNVDDKRCTDIDECKLNTHNCDQICKNIPGSFQCACKKGYIMVNNQCMDIDECVTKEPCPKHSTCSNTPGSYECSCNEGFRKEGKVCINIDECAAGNPCDENAVCQDNEGAYTCTCRSGFKPVGKKCIDIDECKTGVAKCDKNSKCVNTLGSYRCACKSPHWRGNGILPEKCEQVLIDECKTKKNACNKKNKKCVDLDFGYTCHCLKGYTGTDKSNTTCIDIDECKAKQFKCPPNSKCSNLVGSYRCDCLNGYQAKNGKCEDIDECQRGIHRCSPDRSDCVNLPGSYECKCRKGWKRGATRLVCIDDNECVRKPCKANQNCINLPGRYYCACKIGYRMTRNGCVKIGGGSMHVPTPPPKREVKTLSPFG